MEGARSQQLGARGEEASHQTQDPTARRGADHTRLGHIETRPFVHRRRSSDKHLIPPPRERQTAGRCRHSQRARLDEPRGLPTRTQKAGRLELVATARRAPTDSRRSCGLGPRVGGSASSSRPPALSAATRSGCSARRLRLSCDWRLEPVGAAKQSHTLWPRRERLSARSSSA